MNLTKFLSDNIYVVGVAVVLTAIPWPAAVLRLSLLGGHAYWRPPPSGPGC